MLKNIHQKNKRNWCINKREERTYRDYAPTIGEAVNPNSINFGGTHLGPIKPIEANQMGNLLINRGSCNDEFGGTANHNHRYDREKSKLTFLGIMNLRGYFEKHRVTDDLPLIFSTTTEPVSIPTYLSPVFGGGWKAAMVRSWKVKGGLSESSALMGCKLYSSG